MRRMSSRCHRRDPARRLALHLGVSAALLLGALPAAQAGPHADDLTRHLDEKALQQALQERK